MAQYHGDPQSKSAMNLWNGGSDTRISHQFPAPPSNATGKEDFHRPDYVWPADWIWFLQTQHCAKVIWPHIIFIHIILYRYKWYDWWQNHSNLTAGQTQLVMGWPSYKILTLGGWLGTTCDSVGHISLFKKQVFFFHGQRLPSGYDSHFAMV